MKANELMVGDFTRTIYTQKIIKVREIKQSCIYTNDNGYEYNEIEPIPLTSEILEKNGFTCDENIAKLVGRDDTKNILWSAKYSFFTGIMEVVNKVTDEKVRARCYSVHELQNIFRLLEIEKEIII